MRKPAPTPAPAYQDMILLALFAAIIFVLAFTPIGFINLGFLKATIIHLPVIIGSIVLGPRMGVMLGVCFGVASLISNTTAPTVLSFAFSPLIPVPGLGRGSVLALLVCFLPRIVVGALPGLLYRFATRIPAMRTARAKKILLSVCGVAGALANTVLVMGLIYFCFREAYAGIKGVTTNLLLGVIVSGVWVQSLCELALAGALAAFICPALFHFHTEPYPAALPVRTRKPAKTQEGAVEADDFND